MFVECQLCAFAISARECEMTVCATHSPVSSKRMQSPWAKRRKLFNNTMVSLVCDLSAKMWAPEAWDVKNLVRARVPMQRHRYARRALPNFRGSSSAGQECELCTVMMIDNTLNSGTYMISMK